MVWMLLQLRLLGLLRTHAGVGPAPSVLITGELPLTQWHNRCPGLKATSCWQHRRGLHTSLPRCWLRMGLMMLIWPHPLHLERCPDTLALGLTVKALLLQADAVPMATTVRGLGI